MFKEINFISEKITRRMKMAKIIENKKGRRQIRLNTDDIINIVREYQNISVGACCYEHIREKLDKFELYLPED